MLIYTFNTVGPTRWEVFAESDGTPVNVQEGLQLINVEGSPFHQVGAVANHNSVRLDPNPDDQTGLFTVTASGLSLMFRRIAVRSPGTGGDEELRKILTDMFITP